MKLWDSSDKGSSQIGEKWEKLFEINFGPTGIE